MEYTQSVNLIILENEKKQYCLRIFLYDDVRYLGAAFLFVVV